MGYSYTILQYAINTVPLKNSKFTVRSYSSCNQLIEWIRTKLNNWLNNIFIQNSVNAIVFKLQVILLMMAVTEKPKSSYYLLSY